MSTFSTSHTRVLRWVSEWARLSVIKWHISHSLWTHFDIYSCNFLKVLRRAKRDTAVDIYHTCITMLLLISFHNTKKKPYIWQEMQLSRNFNFNELQLHQQRVIAKLLWNFADFIMMRDSIIQLNASWRYDFSKLFFFLLKISKIPLNATWSFLHVYLQ